VKYVVRIELEIEALSESDAIEAVERALDDGGPQEAVNFYAVEVTSALRVSS
jgi:hypothetical protein